MTLPCPVVVLVITNRTWTVLRGERMGTDRVNHGSAAECIIQGLAIK
jgi:hypothetical protein